MLQTKSDTSMDMIDEFPTMRFLRRLGRGFIGRSGDRSNAGVEVEAKEFAVVDMEIAIGVSSGADSSIRHSALEEAEPCPCGR